MSIFRRISLRVAITGFLVVVSLAVGFRSTSRISFFRKQIETRQNELTQLKQMNEDIQRQRTALDWINANTRPEDQVESLVKRHLPGIKNDLILRETQPAGEGWTVHRYDLRIDQSAPDKLGSFLTACESARPPVRILDIQVSPAADSGRGLAAQLSLAEMTPSPPQSAP